MIVQQIGYLNIEKVKNLKQFSIYTTNRKTNVLVLNTKMNEVELYYPKKDKIPYNITEGKRICKGKKIFDSSTDDINNINFKDWNNQNQIMSYEDFKLYS